MNTRDNRPIDNLALSGGAARGFFLIGAFAALEEAGIMQNTKRISAASIGALMALGPAFGMPANEFLAFMLNEVNFPKIQDPDITDENNYRQIHPHKDGFFKTTKNILYNAAVAPYLLGKTGVSFFTKKGVFNGNYTKKIVQMLVHKQFNKNKLTFMELHELAKSDSRYKDLYFSVMNVTSNQLEYFSYETCPDMQIATGVHCAMALQGVYKRVKIDNTEYADGGFYDLLPVKVFDYEKYLKDNTELVGGINARTLGICLSIPERTAHIRDNIPYKKKTNQAEMLVLSALFSQDEHHRFSTNPVRTVYLNTEDIDILNLYVSKDDIRSAYTKSKIETHEYIENYIRGIRDPHPEKIKISQSLSLSQPKLN